MPYIVVGFLRGESLGARLDRVKNLAPGDAEPVDAAALAAPIAVATGPHAVEVRAPGYEPARQSFTVAGRQRREVRAVMRRADAALVNASVTVRGLPGGASAEIDGRAVTPEQPVPVAAGRHALRISAPGFAVYDGAVDVAPGAVRIATVRLGAGGAMGPAPFAVGAGVTVALAVVGTVFGALSLGTLRRLRDAEASGDDAAAARLAPVGSTQQIVADVFFGGAIVTGIVSVVLLTRTRFGPPPAAVDSVFHPHAGGADAALRVRL